MYFLAVVETQSIAKSFSHSFWAFFLLFAVVLFLLCLCGEVKMTRGNHKKELIKMYFLSLTVIKTRKKNKIVCNDLTQKRFRLSTRSWASIERPKPRKNCSGSSFEQQTEQNFHDWAFSSPVHSLYIISRSYEIVFLSIYLQLTKTN